LAQKLPTIQAPPRSLFLLASLAWQLSPLKDGLETEKWTIEGAKPLVIRGSKIDKDWRAGTPIHFSGFPESTSLERFRISNLENGGCLLTIHLV